MTKSILATCMGMLLSIGAFACPTSLNALEQSCGSYVFYLADTPVGNVIWNFGDGDATTGSIEIAHEYAENGMYVVSATFSGPECPQTLTLTATVEVNCGVVNECPTEIWSGAGTECGVMNFEIGSFVDGESVTWFPGDNSGPQQDGHFFTHTYATPGTYNVCAFYTSPLCPNGVELCTTIIVEACNENLCPTAITAEAIDCDTYILHIEGVDNAEVSWDFGDGIVSSGGIHADHTWAQNGTYVITAEVNAPQCPIMPPIGTITFVFTIQIDCPVATECPTIIWSGAGAECGVMNFEIGSFVEGEKVVWYPGDETGAVQGGHFFTHTYANPGSYNVCAFYTSPLCPNGVELCTIIEVAPCEPPCNEIGFGIDSYVLEGGTPWLTYMISNVETGMMVTSGVAEYTQNDPYFDTPLCIPNGCYYLTIDNNNPLLIGQGVNIFFILNSVNLMENATIIYQDNISIQYLIGVNTDCAEPALCETAFEPVYTNTPGHVEFINNSIYTGNAEFLWDYGNGQFSNDFSGNVQYESNGVYSVCLTITTVNCTYSTCQVVVIDNMENACAFNEVTLVVEANYFEPMFDEVFYLTIANGNFPIHELTFETTGNLSDTLGFCLPDGCYGVTLFSESPNMALSFICNFTGENTQQLGELQLSFSETFASAVIGVNMDCTIDVEETNAKTVSAFPNPTSNYIQFAAQESIQLLEIFDMTGKRVASFNPNQLQVQINTSNWSSGLYVAHVIGSEKMERAIFEIAR